VSTVEVIYERCAGLDVGKDEVVACVRVPDGAGGRRQEVCTYPTFSSGLESLAEWLQDHDVTQVVLEATGQYWKPIWYVLEERGLELLLVNARHVKLLPGRKTDVGDAAWLCELPEHGLLRGSFVPPAAIRELRDLTRYRKRLIQAHTAECQRIHKILEDASIRLGSVAADVLGVSGRAMLRALLAGERDPGVLAELARAACARGSPSCARRCGVASAPTTPCWCGWPWTTWSSWSGPSPHWTPRSTGSSPRSRGPVTASTPSLGWASGPPNA